VVHTVGGGEDNIQGLGDVEGLLLLSLEDSQYVEIE
jgi:hypothetical protein